MASHRLTASLSAPPVSRTQGSKEAKEKKKAAAAKKQPKKKAPKKAPKKKAATPSKATKATAKVKAVAAKSSDKRGAVLAKKRGLSAAAIKAAEKKAKNAALSRPKPKKAPPTKGKRVGKKVTIAAIRVTKKKPVANKRAQNKAADGPRAFSPPKGTLRMTISNTPPKPKPGSQRAGARGKVLSSAATRKAANAQRQSTGRGGKLAGARGMDLGVAKRGVSKPKAGAMFPKGMSVTGKVKVIGGQAPAKMKVKVKAKGGRVAAKKFRR